MYLWSRYKFLILFVILLVGGPILMTKASKTVFQGAQTISTETSPCLDNNPPTIWIEKDPNSRKGYAPSGIINSEILTANLTNCGEVNIKGFSFIVETKDPDLILNESIFTLSAFGQNYNVKNLIDYGKGRVLVNFEFEEPVGVYLLGAKQKIKLLGFLPDRYAGKTTFYLDNVSLESGEDSRVLINKVKSSLIFIKKD